MRCPMRTTYAIRGHVNTSHRGIGPKGQLHVTIEVDGEIDLAGIAVYICLNVFQRVSALLWATTQRAEQVPLKVEQTDPRRAQTHPEHESSGFMPIVGELVCTNARDG